MKFKMDIKELVNDIVSDIVSNDYADIKLCFETNEVSDLIFKIQRMMIRNGLHKSIVLTPFVEITIYRRLSNVITKEVIA